MTGPVLPSDIPDNVSAEDPMRPARTIVWFFSRKAQENLAREINEAIRIRQGDLGTKTSTLRARLADLQTINADLAERLNRARAVIAALEREMVAPGTIDDLLARVESLEKRDQDRTDDQK